MVQHTTHELQDFLEQEAGDYLRSIIEYQEEEYEIIFIRDDVQEQYSLGEIDRAIKDSKLESLSGEYYESLFSEDHGDLQCIVKCFERVIEMNFALNDAQGIGIALDAEAMDQAHGLVTEARRIALQTKGD